MAVLYYTPDDYADADYVQTGLIVNGVTKEIFVPQFFLTYLGGSSYALDTNAFRLALKDWEDSEEGQFYDDTHSHNTTVSLGGLEYARVIEMINGYTVTFENGSYSVSLIGSNNNILDVTNLNNVAVRSNNSAGLVQMQEIQQSSYNGKVYIDTVNGVSGTTYPAGTLKAPSSTFADASFIATLRGLGEFYLKGNFTVGATDNVTALVFRGDGATLNVFRSTVTLTQGCVTTNSQWYNCKITGYQGGESLYHDCIIDGLDNAHCIYERCGLVDGTSRGYTIRQTSAVSSGHASYFKECYSDEGTAILDRNGARLNVTFDGFHGRLKIINQNHATSSGQVWIHLNGGTVTVDSTCTKGKITITGFGTLVNNSLGTEVDASGFAAEVAAQAKLDVESLRASHQGFGTRWYVDPVAGTDLAPGTSPASPLKTVTAALSKAVSGRGDVIYLLAPGTGTANIDERIVITKEDVHIRGPGRGIQFQPSVGDLGPVIQIQAPNCSLSNFLLKTTANSSDDGIVLNAKFCRLENLYVVGADTGGTTPVGTGVCLHIKGGDYHKVFNCEIEKAGSDGVRFTDAPISSEGSPREVRFDNCNIYYNRGCGVKFTGTSSNSTRLNVITGSRIQNNSDYGVYVGSNTQRNMIMFDNFIQGNKTYPTGTLDPTNEIYVDPSATTTLVDFMPATLPKGTWDYTGAPVTGSIGEYITKKILTVAKFLGLK
jgi:hypothetical protein